MEGRADAEQVPPPQPASSRATMDHLAALLSERLPQLLSATELHSLIALLDDTARACRAELESRTTTLHALPDEIQQLVFGQMCNALDPRSAVAFSSASNGLRELMQRVDEGANRSLLQQLKEENAEAAALGLKLGVELREVTWITCDLGDGNDISLSATDLATLVKLIPVLPALEELCLQGEWSGSAGPDGRQLVEGLGVGALPAVTHFTLDEVCLCDAGASAHRHPHSAPTACSGWRRGWSRARCRP